MAQDKGCFHYLGIGCLIAAILGVVGFAIFGFAAYRWGKDIGATMKDPAGREEAVLAILGASELPVGYYPMIGIRVPWVLETAILTDQSVDVDEQVPDLGERGLLYFSMRNFGRDRQDLDDFFSGATEDPAVLEKHRINVDLGERVARGQLDRSAGSIHWATHRGELMSDQAQGRHEGLITMFQVECPADNRNRIGMWFGPDPTLEADSTEASLTGSVADPKAVGAFLGHFTFCAE